MTTHPRRCDLTHDLVLPTLLFSAMGGMTWAVRGSSGYGASAGCIFAGVLWGAGWWYIAHNSRGHQTRRYASGWIVLAMTIGFGYSGARGWMQWPHFFDGRLYTNYAKGETVPISPFYGFLWMFIAGVPWAGLGACLLAWCGSLREMRFWDWMLRVAIGVGGAYLGRYLFDTYPQFFLPLYSSIESQYKDLDANPSLKRLINDCGNAVFHLGYYLGFLSFEICRRDWKNVVLILTVGVINGLGWALIQTWKWAPGIWKNANFNWWRCWESSGGISIGIAFGVAYFLVNRRMSDEEQSIVESRRSLAGPNFEWLVVFCGLASYLGLFLQAQTEGWASLYIACLIGFAALYYLLNRRKTTTNASDPNLERLGLYLGLLAGLGISVRSGLKGWFNIYVGDEQFWSRVLWQTLGPVYLFCVIGISAWILFRPRLSTNHGPRFPHAYGLIWFVLIVQNLLGQIVTGPLTEWNEMVFSIYYMLLFAITGVIIVHFHTLKDRVEG